MKSGSKNLSPWNRCLGGGRILPSHRLCCHFPRRVRLPERLARLELGFRGGIRDRHGRSECGGNDIGSLVRSPSST